MVQFVANFSNKLLMKLLPERDEYCHKILTEMACSIPHAASEEVESPLVVGSVDSSLGGEGWDECKYPGSAPIVDPRDWFRVLGRIRDFHGECNDCI
jgi:hypothetical protein